MVQSERESSHIGVYLRWSTKTYYLVAVIGAALALLSHQPSPGELLPSRASTRRISRGEIHSYSISLARDQYARLMVDQREIDLRVRVRPPDDAVPIEIDASPWGREEVSVVAQAAGIYRVEITSDVSDTLRGSYRLTLSELRSAVPDDALRKRAQELFEKAARLDSASPKELAVSLYLEAANCWHSAKDPLGEAHALQALGRVYDRAGVYQKADETYRQAMVLFTTANDEAGRLDSEKAWVNLGGHLGEQRGNLEFLTRQLAEWRKLGDRRGEARLVGSIGTWHGRRYVEAIPYVNRALELHRALGNRSQIARSLEKLSGWHAIAKEYGEAVRYAMEAVQSRRGLGDPRGEASSHWSLCHAYFNSGQFNRARPCLQELRVLQQRLRDKNSELVALQWLSRTESSEGRYDIALQNIDEALRLEEELRQDIRNPIWRVGFGSAAANYKIKLDILADAHARDSAGGYDSAAFLMIDQMRARFIEPKAPFSLVELRRSLGNNEILLSFFVDMRNRGFLWIVERDSFSMQQFPNALRLPVLARELHGHMTARSSLVQGESYQNRLVRLQEAQAAAARLAAEFSSFVLAPAAHRLANKRILVVADEGFAFIPFAILPDPERPGRLLIENHEIVHVPSLTAVLELRKRAAVQRKRERLLALVTNPAFEKSPVMDPALQVAVRAAGLSQNGTRLSPLPFAAKEAAAIASMIPSSSITKLAGLAATRDAVLSKTIEGHQILHFTTHGMVNLENPEMSGLILSLVDAEGRSSNGFLRLQDILGLNIQADLVTLAACQTALGREVPGHGVISLASAFLRAGASQVISTSWKIDDEATAELTEQFYRALLIDRLAAPAALRRAQLTLLHSGRWQSSYFWGAFALYGDWLPISFTF